MLQSVTGMITRHGLRSLQLEREEAPPIPRQVPATLPVWAVIDSQDLQHIHRALREQQPAIALRLLNDNAVSIGSICG